MDFFTQSSQGHLVWTYFIVYIYEHIQKVWTQVLTSYSVLTLHVNTCDAFDLYTYKDTYITTYDSLDI